VRSLAFAALIAVSSLAVSAQPEKKIQDAFAALRDKNQVHLHLEGTDRLGNRTSQILVDGYWHRGVTAGRPFAHLWVHNYRGPEEVFRAVADGMVLWQYDPKRSEYSATAYGSYRGPQPDDYEDVLLRNVNAGTRGPANHLIRLMREIWGGDDALYRSWMPGYQPVDEGTTITYRAEDAMFRQVTFHIDLQNGELRAVSYYDRTRVGAEERILEWTLTIRVYEEPQNWQFAFTPPPGTRAVSGIRPVG
jgi:hypothetical protein